MRIAFVVQRYGEDVAGGAEALCRSTARELAARGDEVEVHTTTARDYLTWAAHYPEGTTVEDGVSVHRYAVSPPDPSRAAALVRALALSPGDAAGEREWALAQGPVSPALVRAVAATANRVDAVALWTYLYATTQLTMPVCAGRGILVPLAHDEPMMRFTLTRGLMRSAAGFAFMTPEEALLVADLHGVGNRPAQVVGAGLDAAPPGDADTARLRYRLPDRFALYVGRVDPAKGVDALIDAHAAYRAAGGRLGLVLAGRESASLPMPDWVVRTGFTTEAERGDLLAAAEVVVLPSRHESLSLVALEAWQAARPTLANGRCEVLAGQTRRSGAGMQYMDAPDYVARLNELERDAEGRARMGGAGVAFTAPLTWDSCVARWRVLASRVMRASDSPGERPGGEPAARHHPPPRRSEPT